MDQPDPLRQQLKELMVENLMLRTPIEEIADDLPLFGPGSLGLDSVDALQLVVALEKRFGLKIANPDEAKRTLATINSMTEAVSRHQSKP